MRTPSCSRASAEHRAGLAALLALALACVSGHAGAQAPRCACAPQLDCRGVDFARTCAPRLRAGGELSVLDFMSAGQNADDGDDTLAIGEATCCAAWLLQPDYFAALCKEAKRDEKSCTVPAKHQVVTVDFPPGRYVTQGSQVFPGTRLTGYGATLKLPADTRADYCGSWTGGGTIFSTGIALGFPISRRGTQYDDPARDSRPIVIEGFVFDGNGGAQPYCIPKDAAFAPCYRKNADGSRSYGCGFGVDVTECPPDSELRTRGFCGDISKKRPTAAVCGDPACGADCGNCPPACRGFVDGENPACSGIYDDVLPQHRAFFAQGSAPYDSASEEYQGQGARIVASVEDVVCKNFAGDCIYVNSDVAVQVTNLRASEIFRDVVSANGARIDVGVDGLMAKGSERGHSAHFNLEPNERATDALVHASSMVLDGLVTLGLRKRGAAHFDHLDVRTSEPQHPLWQLDRGHQDSAQLVVHDANISGPRSLVVQGSADIYDATLEMNSLAVGSDIPLGARCLSVLEAHLPARSSAMSLEDVTLLARAPAECVTLSSVQQRADGIWASGDSARPRGALLLERGEIHAPTRGITIRYADVAARGTLIDVPGRGAGSWGVALWPGAFDASYASDGVFYANPSGCAEQLARATASSNESSSRVSLLSAAQLGACAAPSANVVHAGRDLVWGRGAPDFPCLPGDRYLNAGARSDEATLFVCSAEGAAGKWRALRP